MQRRQFLGGIGGCFAAVSLAGCAGVLPGGEQDPKYPGGTLVLENKGDNSVLVSVRAKLEQYDASLEADIAGGETVVREEFVSAEQGDIVTLEAVLGETGDSISFQFLPEGSDENPPEVAVLTVENAVEASANWSATAGRRQL